MSKSIRLTGEAHERDDGTFSDVVLRLAGEPVLARNITDFERLGVGIETH